MDGVGMTTCKLCKTDIPDGKEYCEDCLKKMQLESVNKTTSDSQTVDTNVKEDDEMYEQNLTDLLEEEKALEEQAGIVTDSVIQDDTQHMDKDDISSLLDDISINEDTDKSKNLNEFQTEKNHETPSDVGEVFSDTLKVVSALEDKDTDSAESLEQLADNEADNKKKKNKGKKEKGKKNKKEKNKKEKNKNRDIAEAVKESDEDSEGKNKSNILVRLFRKYVDKNAKGKPATETSVQMKDKKSIKAAKAGKNKGKIIKGKKVIKGNIKAVIPLANETDEDEGRINRTGAFIVVFLCGIMMIFLLTGTKAFSYQNTINSASKYFYRQKYTNAYDAVCGLDIKDKDIEIYNKIRTVMFVNRELDAYHNFYIMKKYPEALNSLLRGMDRYNKYIDLAEIYGISSDMDTVKGQIVSELGSTFNLTEEKAIKIIKTKSNNAYSIQIYEVISKMKMS
jgi:hypothetical protein